MKIKKPEVRVLPISQLKPWPKNPRKNHAIDAIAKSIESFGYLAPIIAQENTYRVLAGHGRLLALKKLGVKDVPCIVADIDDDRADLYTLADNKLQEAAEWDIPKMADLLLEFDAKGLDVSLTGFDKLELEEIANWIPENDKEETQPVPEPPKKPISEVGDLWVLGHHRLLCGDSTKPEDVAKVMGDMKAGLLHTDPPYGVNYPGIANDDLKEVELKEFIEGCIRAAIPHLIRNPAIYLWNPILAQGLYAAAAVAEAVNILIHRQIVWVKPSFVLGRGHYHWRHDLCFYGWFKGRRCVWLGGRDQATVWEVGSEQRNHRIHPTQKPVELFVRPIENHLRPGEACYEPFAGSGAQIIAAEKTGRRCYAIEIEPRYVDVCIQRWQNFTGAEAKNLTRPDVQIG